VIFIWKSECILFSLSLSLSLSLSYIYAFLYFVFFIIYQSISGTETRWASRSGYLDPQALLRFNNAPVIVKKYGTSIENSLFQHLQAQYSKEKQQDIAYIRVFGELFGGKYEGFTMSHKAIQKEIAYCPDIEFIIFDIECILSDNDDEAERQSEAEGEGGKETEDTETEDTEKEDTAEEKEESSQEQQEQDETSMPSSPSSSSFFLNPDQVIQACHSCALPALQVLHSGSLTDMLALSQVFQSTLPTTFFNLPPPSHNNESEGYVLKPKSQVFHKPDGDRIMLKHKNPKFTENKSVKTVKVPKTVIPGANDLSESELAIFEDMKQFINENRINAVLSKLDEATRSKRKGVFFLIAKDAMEDILIEMAERLKGGTKKEKGKYNKQLMKYTEEYCNFHQIDFSS
jgi:hypothetical protein